ncbi:hypothetical protein [Gaiella sp.]|jgi:hypothetical protein|uniref:hypothetical protein n=1 Tax=Gaiella sp. TaxID=2663207 RepID=UPI002BD6BC5D|nr:hypothetical protein [Gaiella sp.]HWO80659.1 hypothetical protein [Gaiella sp.]
MASPRSRQAARLRDRRRRAQRRARRLVVLSVLGVLGLVTLLFTAFGSSGSSNVAAPIAIETVSSADAAAVRPRPQVLASIGNLRVQLPVAAGALTAIGFHGSGDGSLSLQPVGRQANEGLLARLWRRIAGNGRQSPRWYQLEGGPAGTNVLDVGTAPGTDVYAPVKGSVIAVSDLVIGGKRVGSRIDLRPSEAPSVMVSVENVRPDPAIVVGTPVLAATSKLGTAVDIASVEKQALAAHAPEGGNNVSIAVYPSPGSLP